MCLHLKKSQYKIKIAKKDLVCYKMFYFKNYNTKDIKDGITGVVRTYYKYKFNEINNTELDSLNNVKRYGIVNYGFHSYNYKKDILSDEKNWAWHIIVKCIIPKGSEYYNGYNPEYDSDRYKRIEVKQRVSNKLKPVEVIMINKFDN